MQNLRSAAAKVLPYILWLVSATAWFGAVIGLYEIVSALVLVLMPIDPMQRVASGYRITLVTRGFLIAAAIGYIFLTSLLLERYARAGKLSDLFRRFAIITVIGLLLFSARHLAIPLKIFLLRLTS